jgi:hypothetical protein
VQIALFAFKNKGARRIIGNEVRIAFVLGVRIANRGDFSISKITTCRISVCQLPGFAVQLRKDSELKEDKNKE